MRVLVTGAGGFLGRHVTEAVLRRGHEVRAMVRTEHSSDTLREATSRADPHSLEVVQADLRRPSELAGVCDGVDAIIHLAAVVAGDEESQFRGTVVGTENLLHEARVARIRRFVLASSFSVYDWQLAGRTLSEQSPLERHIYSRDGYAIAKFWQERVVRRFADQTSTSLAVLRPGFIWGRDNLDLAGLGQRIGKWYLLFGPHRPLPLTYVENCAECFAICVDHPAAEGDFNVIDRQRISAWAYAGRLMRLEAFRGRRLYTPYWMAALTAQGATWCSRRLFAEGGKLPGILMPNRFRARFRPLRFADSRVREVLGWESKWGFADAWQRATDPCSSPEPADSPEVAHA